MAAHEAAMTLLVLVLGVAAVLLAVVGGRLARGMAQRSDARDPPLGRRRIALILLSYLLVSVSLAILIFRRPGGGSPQGLLSQALAVLAIAAFGASMKGSAR